MSNVVSKVRPAPNEICTFPAIPSILMQTTASESLSVSDGIKGGMNHGNAEKENA
jgi:hypothetical protein